MIRLAAAFAVAGGMAAAECAPVPDPVHVLSYGSRYVAGTGSTVLDTAAQAEVEDELGPVDDLIRQVAGAADSALDGDVARATCALDALTVWAEAGALGALESRTARLTIGSRIAGLALVALKLRRVAPAHPGWPIIEPWLGSMIAAQQEFWEAEAPDGARIGNLRAWAALAGVAVAEVTGDPVTRAWGTWSAAYVACSAAPDGSLPQEMTRGKHALHYQLHAVAPLMVSAALLDRHGIDLLGQCGGALDRAARFAAADLATGAASQAITGEIQSFFDGSRDLGAFQLAWLEAWLRLRPDPAVEALAAEWRPLSNSKLGGDQAGLWAE